MKVPTLTLLYPLFAAVGILAAIPTSQAAKAAAHRARKSVTKVVVSIATLAGAICRSAQPSCSKYE